MKNKKTTYILIAVIILFIVTIVNAYFSGSLNFNRNTSKREDILQVIKPEIEITYINATDCNSCTDITSLSNIIASNGGNVINVKELNEADKEAQDLITKYEITKLSSAIISGELKKDEKLFQELIKIGVEYDNKIIVKQIAPPYKDLTDGKIKGIISLKLLSDRNCQECYDPTIHEKVLANYGIKSNDTQIVDVTSIEGRDLINKYNIMLVPTFILSGDTKPYLSLNNVWPKVGTNIDNAMILTEGVKEMGIYKDLKTGEIIKPVEKSNSYINTTPQEFQQLIRNGNTILLDVRAQAEYDAGHIEGAILIPVDELGSRLKELDSNKDILVYCHSGNRSAKASQILIDNGFKTVHNLEKGIVEWENQNLPIIKQ